MAVSRNRSLSPLAIETCTHVADSPIEEHRHCDGRLEARYDPDGKHWQVRAVQVVLFMKNGRVAVEIVDHRATGGCLEERQDRHAGITRSMMYHARPTPITTYPRILPLGTIDRRAPANTTSTAMKRRFVVLSIVDQVCRVPGSKPCQPFCAGVPVLFLCSPIPGSSTINNHESVTIVVRIGQKARECNIA